MTDAALSSTVDPNVARRAAEWLAHLHSEDATAADWKAFERWKQAAPAHEQAWQRAERVSLKLGMIPRPLGAGPLLALPAKAAARQTRRRKVITAMTLLILAGPVGIASYQQLPWRVWRASHKTGTGEIRNLVLPDGGQLSLDTASALDIDYSDQWRRLDLQAGAIRIQTAADDANRPFVVHSRVGRIRALGTKFAVSLQDDRRCLVQVMEGAVEMQPALRQHATQVISAGQQAWLSPDSMTPPEALAANAGTWADGVLYAEHMRLDDFLREVARYRQGILGCDPDISGLRVSGTFQLRDTDAILASLAEAMPVTVQSRTRYWITLIPA